jgi:hypothetical protein
MAEAKQHHMTTLMTVPEAAAMLTVVVMVA